MPITVAIFDIGFRNLAMAIEQYSNKDLKILIQKYSKLDKKSKIIERRQHSAVVTSILNDFYKTGKTLLLQLTDLNKGEKNIGLQNSTRKNLDEYLKSKLDILNTCNYIIIEAQFKTGQACNFDAILLGESLYSWCVFNLDIPVFYTPSRLKTCLLGCPRQIIEIKENGLRVARDIVKKDRKKWSTQMAISILNLRKDQKTIEYIQSRKSDDISDCILMGLAWILKRYVMD